MEIAVEKLLSSRSNIIKKTSIAMEVLGSRLNRCASCKDKEINNCTAFQLQGGEQLCGKIKP